MSPEQARYDAFLSHNGADKPWARSLATALRGAGLSVFFDEDSIKLGDDVPRAIEAGIRSSRHVLLVLSPEATASHWVALESSVAIYSDPISCRRFVIPVLRKECEIPLLLRRLNHLDARHGSIEEHLPRLLTAIGRDAGSPEQVTADALTNVGPTFPEPTTPRSKTIRRFAAHLPPPPGHPRYLERVADTVAKSMIEIGGMLIITGRRRIGKTSLLFQAAAFAERVGKKVIFLDLQTYSGSGEHELFSSLARRIAVEIDSGKSQQSARESGRAAFIEALRRIPQRLRSDV